MDDLTKHNLNLYGTVAEVRAGDLAQRIETTSNDPSLRTIWLVGTWRIRGGHVGARVRLVYVTSPASGRWVGQLIHSIPESIGG